MIAASEYDESLKDDCDILADIENLISDVAHNLSSYMDDFTFDQYNRNYIVQRFGGKDENTAEDFYEPGTVLA